MNGYYYQNTASVNVVVPTPATGTTGHRIVLRATVNSQTVRIALKSSNDGTSSIPGVQQDSQVWETSLATLTINTSGTITVNDARDYCHVSPALLYRRLGNSSTDFAIAGGSSYTVGAVRIQTGVIDVSFDSDNDSSTKTVTFPQEYSGKPFIYLTTYNNGIANANRVNVTVYGQGKTSFTIRGRREASWTQNVPVMWLAIGPK